MQVGSQAERTLTRAFVFSTAGKINIDFNSEATVRLVLAEIPPAGLCDYSPDDLRDRPAPRRRRARRRATRPSSRG